jgi:hypothetical protein
MTLPVLVLVLLAAGPPRGKPTPRPEPNRVIVRNALLEAGGVTAQVARGVSAREEGGRVLLLGDVEISGHIEPDALGVRLAHDTAAYAPAAPAGERIGTVLAGALVHAGATVGGRVVCDVTGPVRARVAIDAGALTAKPQEFVFPEHRPKRLEAQAEAPLWSTAARGPVRATLAPEAQVVVLETLSDLLRVRTYGELELEGYVPKKLFEPAGSPYLVRPPTGLNPTHEALIDTPIFADPAGRTRIGQLRGGALVTAGKDLSGGRRKVMTHGGVVAEVWVADADLRPVDAKNWLQGL